MRSSTVGRSRERRGAAQSTARRDGWSPHTGWLYSADELAERVDGDAYVLTVSEADGMVRGVTVNDHAPLVALLRVEVDMTEIVQRLDDLGDTVAGLDAAEAGDKAEVLMRLRALTERVAALEAAT